MSRKQYLQIVFMQGDDAREPLAILDKQGESAALDFLSEWDYGDACPTNNEPNAGTSDTVYKQGNYLLTYNTGLGYIGLDRVTEEEG